MTLSTWVMKPAASASGPRSMLSRDRESTLTLVAYRPRSAVREMSIRTVASAWRLPSAEAVAVATKVPVSALALERDCKAPLSEWLMAVMLRVPSALISASTPMCTSATLLSLDVPMSTREMAVPKAPAKSDSALASARTDWPV